MITHLTRYLTAKKTTQTTSSKLFLRLIIINNILITRIEKRKRSKIAKTKLITDRPEEYDWNENRISLSNISIETDRWESVLTLTSTDVFHFFLYPLAHNYSWHVRSFIIWSTVTWYNARSSIFHFKVSYNTTISRNDF